MASILAQLEMEGIARMSRQELLGAIRARLDCLPADLREGLDGQPAGQLQLLLLTARLTYALRTLRGGDWEEDPPPG